MHVLLVSNFIIPPITYGGIERVVFWLAQELTDMGHDVTVMSKKGSEITQWIPRVKWIRFPAHWEQFRQIVPRDIDVIHFHETPPRIPDKPYIVTYHNNGKPFERFTPNTVFLSRSHAENHGAKLFVYNGVPLRDYPLQQIKQDYMLFMAHLPWRVKNAKTAIHLSLDTHMPVMLAGGHLYKEPKLWGPWMLRLMFAPAVLVESFGKVNNAAKLNLLQNASVLFYIANWQEPFCLAAHEALACGTPILASVNGAFPEYVKHGVNGYLVESYQQAVDLIRHHRSLSDARRSSMAEACRQTAFSARQMTEDYAALYNIAISNKYLYPPEEASRFRFRPKRCVIVKRHSNVIKGICEYRHPLEGPSPTITVGVASAG